MQILTSIVMCKNCVHVSLDFKKRASNGKQNLFDYKSPFIHSTSLYLSFSRWHMAGSIDFSFLDFECIIEYNTW